MNKTALDAFRGSLMARYFLRFHMSFLLAATIACGLAASKLLLEAGLTDVRLRYPLALVLAYAVFLGLVRVWISYVTAIRLPWPRFDSLDVSLPGPGSADASAPVEFGGGEFGGGGASASWGDAELPAVEAPDLGFDAGEAIWLIVVLVVVIGIACGAGLWLVWIAPELLADVACAALLAASLRGPVQRLERAHWTGRLLARTWIPLGAVTLAVFGLAVVVRWSCPAAIKLAQAFACPAQ